MLTRRAPTAMVATAACLALAASLVAACSDTSLGTQQGYQPVQPIAFSHATHAGEYKMDCRYCHFAAEKSRHAGIPPVNVCMNCHSKVKTESPEIQKVISAWQTKKPIEWIKVHRLPDYAYFNHANHVNAKVACQTCHGPVETMVRVEQVETMTMGWCLDCHRKTAADPANAGKLSPPTDCAACHR